MIKVDLVPTNIIDQVWPQVVDGFQKASDRFGGDLTTGDLWMGCRAGHCFLIVVHEDNKVLAATVWKPETWTSGVKFRCLALYGRVMDEWLDDLIALATRLAQDCGATEAVFEGREGWFRKLNGIRRVRSTFAIKVPRKER